MSIKIAPGLCMNRMTCTYDTKVAIKSVSNFDQIRIKKESNFDQIFWGSKSRVYGGETSVMSARSKNVCILLYFTGALERCQSGRMGVPGKDVYPKGYQGFESLPLR